MDVSGQLHAPTIYPKGQPPITNGELIRMLWFHKATGENFAGIKFQAHVHWVMN
jgi:hypothetical protein